MLVRLADNELVALSLGVDEALDVSVNDGVTVALGLAIALAVTDWLGVPDTLGDDDPDLDGVPLDACDID